MESNDQHIKRNAQTDDSEARESSGEDGAGKLVREPGTSSQPLNDDQQGTRQPTEGPAANI